jgi:glycosyltransferase involved in cell wall biosynthesis
MRILFISNLYPPYDLGGWEQQCKEVVEVMRLRGHVCHVLTSRFGTHAQQPAEEGVTRMLYLETDIYHYRPLDFFLRRFWREMVNRRVLREVIEAFQPDIIFIWGLWNLSSRVAYWAEQWMPDRVAYNLEGYWPIDTDPHRAYWRKLPQSPTARILFWPAAQLALGILKTERYPPRLQFKHVSCCSQYVADVLTKAGVISAGAVVIWNGIDPAPFMAYPHQAHAPNESLRLLYFGALAEHKGVHTAIEAVGLLKQRGQADRLQLTIVGSGHPHYEDRLHGLTKSLALEEKVQFVGWVPRSEIPKILQNHDVFLFTSIWDEPFGRTIIEAMAAGLAVIGADVGGSREIFQFYPKNMLFAPGDAETLANHILRFLNEPDLVEELGKAGRSLVLERFTLERMVDEMEAWLAEVVA